MVILMMTFRFKCPVCGHLKGQIFRHLLNDDQDGFEEMVDRGTKAWEGVPDATEWVEDMRGNG